LFRNQSSLLEIDFNKKQAKLWLLYLEAHPTRIIRQYSKVKANKQQKH